MADTKVTTKTTKAAKTQTAKTVKPQFIPRITEKSYANQAQNTYIFQVPLSAEKIAIKRSIEDSFNVTVTSVRTLIRNGKSTRFSRGKHAYPGTTFRQDKKYAYITLKDGDTIPGIFEETDDASDAKSATSSAKTTNKKGAK